MKTKLNLPLEERIELAEAFGRSNSLAEAAIARESISNAMKSFRQSIKNAEERFNLECWNLFTASYSEAELEEMQNHLKHKKEYFASRKI